MTKKAEDNISTYPASIDTRVALLEQSIIHFNDALNRIESALYEIKIDVKEVRREMKNDFRFLITAISGFAAIMAHGFHWF